MGATEAAKSIGCTRGTVATLCREKILDADWGPVTQQKEGWRIKRTSVAEVAAIVRQAPNRIRAGWSLRSQSDRKRPGSKGKIEGFRDLAQRNRAMRRTWEAKAVTSVAALARHYNLAPSTAWGIVKGAASQVATDHQIEPNGAGTFATGRPPTNCHPAASSPTVSPKRRGPKRNPKTAAVYKACYEGMKQLSLKEVRVQVSKEYPEPDYSPPKSDQDVSSYAHRHADRNAEPWPLPEITS